MSAHASSSSSVFSGTLPLPAADGGRKGSYAATSMPMPCALRATVPPMRPRPMTPSRLPSSSKPVSPAFGHSPGLHAGIGARDVAREREQQRQRVFGGGERVAVGRVHHRDAARGRGLDVDGVDAGAGAADHAQAASHGRAPRRCTGGRRAHQQRVDAGERGARAAAGSLIGSETATSQPASRNRARPSSWMPSQASTFIRTLRQGRERGRPCEPAGRNRCVPSARALERSAAHAGRTLVGKRGRLAWESATGRAYHARPTREQAPCSRRKAGSK